ncbi:hypothetical protein TNCV_4191601 [Trichonephila clavipes]|nr:hypothetical protein TNCV_4191601 [Trichonephila clavipes]
MIAMIRYLDHWATAPLGDFGEKNIETRLHCDVTENASRNRPCKFEPRSRDENASNLVKADFHDIVREDFESVIYRGFLVIPPSRIFMDRLDVELKDRISRPP